MYGEQAVLSLTDGASTAGRASGDHDTGGEEDQVGDTAQGTDLEENAEEENDPGARDPVLDLAGEDLSKGSGLAGTGSDLAGSVLAVCAGSVPTANGGGLAAGLKSQDADGNLPPLELRTCDWKLARALQAEEIASSRKYALQLQTEELDDANYDDHDKYESKPNGKHQKIKYLKDLLLKLRAAKMLTLRFQ